MICARTSDGQGFPSTFTNGVETGIADTTPANGGAEAAFRPHELLEAALATCINITIDMYAKRHHLAVRSAETSVMLDRSQDGRAIFRYQIEIDGDLTEVEMERVRRSAKACSVHKTLLREISFEETLSPVGVES